MISHVSFFTGYLEFVPKSSIPPLEGLDMCHPRHLIYLLFPSLGVMLRVSTTLHLPVAHDITRQLANCDENYLCISM